MDAVEGEAELFQLRQVKEARGQLSDAVLAHTERL